MNFKNMSILLRNQFTAYEGEDSKKEMGYIVLVMFYPP